MAVLHCWQPGSARGAAVVWNQSAGGSWNAATNWTPNDIPETAGDSATFNGAASASNPDQTANRPVTLDGAKTVGAIIFNNDLGNLTNSIMTGSGGPLTLDEAGEGPATITTMGTGSASGINTVSVATVLADSLVATTNNLSTAGSGSLNLTTAMSGPGGFTKQGDGLATFGTGQKTYQGATVLAGGRMRISAAAQPSATSSFTVNAGAQLTLLASGGSFTFGSGPLNLNGTGTTTGPFVVFPGAIRNETGSPSVINNPVVLQSDSLVHIEGAATGSVTFSNSVSGPGSLTLTAPSSSFNQGQLVLNGANTYAGGTFVNGGNLVASGAAATFGTGNVVVDNALSADSNARLTIQSGVLNAIADTATLSLAGGRAGNSADTGFAFLDAGVNEAVGALLLAGVAQVPGTYGSGASSATFKNDEFFSGLGTIAVIPEPGAAMIAAVTCAALLAPRRPRRQS